MRINPRALKVYTFLLCLTLSGERDSEALGAGEGTTHAIYVRVQNETIRLFSMCK